MHLADISDRLARDLEDVQFQDPITHVYQPLDYARAPHVAYLKKWGTDAPREVLLVGMNPGPWGMGQTGVPFGAVPWVRDFLDIEEPVTQPETLHPKRPVDGFDCHRNEASGKRLWGWAKERFGSAGAFFSRFFVANYCPLLIYDEKGRNVTPSKLRVAEKEQIFPPCDRALRALVDHFEPEVLIGIGRFAERRIKDAIGTDRARVGYVLHPSPANPRANRGWAEQAEKQLRDLDIDL